MQNRAADEPLRVLLTGAGSIGKRHAANLRELASGVQLAMVCGSEESLAWAQRNDVKAVVSVEAALAWRPMMAVVCSASSRHAHDLAILLPAVDALYIEKPVVTTVDALRLLRSAVAEGWSKPSVVGCNLRYLGAVGKLQQALAQGVAGHIAIATLQVGQWLPDWRPGRDYRECYSAHRDQGGGVIFDLVHEIDSAVNLFGDIAHGQAAAGRSSGLQIESDDAAAITLQMKSGLPVQVTLDYTSRKPVREYRAVGDKGTLILDVIARSLALATANSTQDVPTQASDWDMAATYKLAMQDLLDAWRTGAATRYSLAQSLHVTQWMIDLEASAWRLK
ncbi:MAG: Gfo/Idh/MocA family oxidoreductase, partial [Ramlibacter sp.]|nr:Gfo/Idh/MocA family oxidoreductase [Ramlibacter sp.]